MTTKLVDYFIFGPITAVRYYYFNDNFDVSEGKPSKGVNIQVRHVFLYRKHKHIDHQETWSIPDLHAILGTEGRVSLHRIVSNLCVASTERKPPCASVWFVGCGWYLTLAMISEQETLDRFFNSIA